MPSSPPTFSLQRWNQHPDKWVRLGKHFDGQKFVATPAVASIKGGRVVDLLPPGTGAPDGAPEFDLSAFLVTPGFVQAHGHIHLDGDELDPGRRKAYLAADRELKYRSGKTSLGRYLEAGVTRYRDAGDNCHVNLRLKHEVADGQTSGPRMIVPGMALHKPGRYGGFYARAVEGERAIKTAVQQERELGADWVKVVISGIISFKTGTMTSPPQFSEEEARWAIEEAGELGMKTFCHASGDDSVQIAIRAGFHTIEHGFFVSDESLAAMADRGMGWTPTFTPVWIQTKLGHGPEVTGRLARICEDHRGAVRKARDLGIAIMAGDDAGSMGVGHGSGFVQELALLAQVLGRAETLTAATSTPARVLGLPDEGVLARGAQVDWNLFDTDLEVDASPFPPGPKHLILENRALY